MAEQSSETPQDESTGSTPDSADKRRIAHDPNPNVWEWWARIALVLGALLVVAWIIVLLRLGEFSVYVHALVLPTLGALTVPIMFWGLLRTLFRPPAVRKPRTIAFLLLVVVGYLGNVPTFAAPVSTNDWKAEQPYRLPFDGTWYTLAGGDDPKHNYHGTTATYRWAYDFTQVKDGKMHRLDGATNEDYYCFGQPVLAPIAGKVLAIENTEMDNVPGEVAPSALFGNHIVLKVNENEFVFLAHMKKGSIPVQPGDSVNQGEKLGECGNSGRSLKPHLHIHLQNTTNFPYSESLPLRFSKYQIGDQTLTDAMPVGSAGWDTIDGESVTHIP